MRSLTAPSVASTARRTGPIWRHQAVITPTAGWLWRCDWWSKMVCPTVRPAGPCGETTGCLSPVPRSRMGWRRGEKKAQARMDTAFLDWALAAFSGYVAAAALYDGPFCLLSAVDNRRYQRSLAEGLEHDPTHDDIRAFLGRLKTALEARDLTLRGVTTDGSSRYPEPLREVFGAVPHQRCAFPVLAEVVKAVVGAVASERKCLGAKQPT